MKTMQFTFCSEEIYFQTVLLNSEHAKNIVNDCLRYIDWSSGRGGYPAFLDVTDYEKIKTSNNIFARKFREQEIKEFECFLTNEVVSNLSGFEQPQTAGDDFELGKSFCFKRMLPLC